MKYCLDKQDEVVYYDPCESPEELKVADLVLGLPDGANGETRELRRRRQQLEQKRGRICARRAYLRSRKVGQASPSSLPGVSPFLKHRQASKIRP